MVNPHKFSFGKGNNVQGFRKVNTNIPRAGLFRKPGLQLFGKFANTKKRPTLAKRVAKIKRNDSKKINLFAAKFGNAKKRNKK